MTHPFHDQAPVVQSLRELRGPITMYENRALREGKPETSHGRPLVNPLLPDGSVNRAAVRRFITPRSQALAIRILETLKDHQWHAVREFFACGTTEPVGHCGLRGLPIAESDSARYICLPDESTPLLAPDGT